MVCGAPEHHAIDMNELVGDLFVLCDAAVDHDGQRRKILFEPMDVAILERWNFPVFLRRESLQNGIARMDEKRIRARLRHGPDEVAHERVVFDAVDADAMLDGDW